MSNVLMLVDAINVRNEIDKGIHDGDWVREQALRLAQAGVLNDSHIACLLDYSRSWVSALVRREKARAGQEQPEGGTLNRDSLDVMLTLAGGVDGPAQGRLLQELIAQGNGTRLISRFTGISIGTILYQQRKMKEESA